MFNKRSAYYFLIGFLCFFSPSFAQEQAVADSLRLIYDQDELKGLEKLELLQDLSFNEVNDLNLALDYAQELIDLSELVANKKMISSGYLRRGAVHSQLGNLELALQDFIKSAEASIEANFSEGEGIAYMSIADVYAIMGHFENGDLYYKKAIAILRNTSEEDSKNDSISLAGVLLNAGDHAFNHDKYDLALTYLNESGLIYENVDYAVGKAYYLGNVGMVYAEQGKDNLAEARITEAVRILEDIEHFYPISVYLTFISDIYARKGEYDKSFNYLENSLNLATKYGLKDQIRDTYKKLSEFHEETGDSVKAYYHYKNYIQYRDSLYNLQQIQQTADLRTNFEISQRENQIELAEQRRINQRNILIATAVALFLFLILAIGLFRRNKFIQRTKKIIEEERDRSDSLLLNILPEETADELKRNGSVQAKKYEAVTVLFSDFKGFTSYSEKLSPEELVKTIGYYFSKFDDIVEKHGLEKIKTIGDAYMCAGGLYNNQNDHAHKMLLAAQEIIEFVNETKEDDAAKDLSFDIRVGINTGPVVAGVVGKHKFAYDIWGDTVNVASRMESMSEPGKINISENTYELVKDQWECEYRGEIEAKNRGVLKMYFVKN